MFKNISESLSFVMKDNEGFDPEYSSKSSNGQNEPSQVSLLASKATIIRYKELKEIIEALMALRCQIATDRDRDELLCNPITNHHKPGLAPVISCVQGVELSTLP